MLIRPLHTNTSFSPDLPGSKSHANRALVLAALSDGPFRIEGATACDDVVLMIRGLQSLGFEIDWVDRTAGIVEGVGGLPRQAPDGSVTIDCELAGTTLRFLCAIAALVPGEWVLDGNDRMRTRPIAPLVDALSSLGVEIEAPTGCPPVRLRGGSATASEVRVDATVSSQFLSALLLAGCRWPGGLHIEATGGETASEGYVEITEQVMASFGVAPMRDRGWRITEQTPRAPTPFVVEKDASGFGPWGCLHYVTSNTQRLELPECARDSSQPDWGLIDVLRKITDFESIVIDLSPIPDQAMNLAVVAALWNGKTSFVGGANLRTKESDRIAATVAMLHSAGVAAEETEDGFVVWGGQPLQYATIETHGDHRLAIAGSLIGLLGRGSEIDDPDCVSKSYPDWFEHVEQALDHQSHVLLIGMRGAGKTTVGKRLAEEMDRPFVDTDAVFEERHGPIADFVAEHGWPEMRRLEHDILHETLRSSGRGPLICAAGGGAVEGGPLRPPGQPRDRVFCVWIHDDLETLAERVAPSDRPSLTGRPPAEELAEVFAARQSLYWAHLDLFSPPGLTVQQRVDAIQRYFRVVL